MVFHVQTCQSLSSTDLHQLQLCPMASRTTNFKHELNAANLQWKSLICPIYSSSCQMVPLWYCFIFWMIRSELMTKVSLLWKQGKGQQQMGSRNKVNQQQGVWSFIHLPGGCATNAAFCTKQFVSGLSFIFQWKCVCFSNESYIWQYSFLVSARIHISFSKYGIALKWYYAYFQHMIKF